MQKTYDVPVHPPDELFPVMTSQYEPAAKEVLNVVVQAESALLIATNPADPEIRRRRQNQEYLVRGAEFKDEV